MNHTVECPHCRRKLAIDVLHLGSDVICPICKETFRPPPLAADPVEEPLPYRVRDEEEAAPRWSDAPAASPGRAFAERAGIDLDETHDESAGSQAEAHARLARWKDDLPEVASAYQPSGKLPLTAIVALVIGTPVGAVGGAVAFLLAFGLTTALLFGIAWVLDLMAAGCGRVLCILVIVGVLVGIVGYALSFGALGWASAVITTSAGMIGKNRNALAAMFFSVASSLAALVLALVSVALITLWMFGPPDAAGKGDPAPWMTWVVRGSLILGTLIAIVSAAWFSRQMVKDSKFCEDCEEFMEEQGQRGLSLGATRAVALALNEGAFDVAADLLGSPQGKDGVPTLYHCAKCGKGYAEVQVKFNCSWVNGENTESKGEEWLAASVPLEPADVERLRRRDGTT